MTATWRKSQLLTGFTGQLGGYGSRTLDLSDHEPKSESTAFWCGVMVKTSKELQWLRKTETNEKHSWLSPTVLADHKITGEEEDSGKHVSFRTFAFYTWRQSWRVLWPNVSRCDVKVAASGGVASQPCLSTLPIATWMPAARAASHHLSSGPLCGRASVLLDHPPR